MTNGGGLRADLPAGDLTYGQLFEAMPFDNRFAVLKITGRRLREVLRRNLSGDGGILSLSGMRVQASCNEGVLDIKIEREPVPAGKRKVVADTDPVVLVTSDFLATGGDSMGIGDDASAPGATAKAPTIEPTVIRDALERTLRARGGALRAAELYDANKRRIVYPGERPVRCAPR
jgi:5'-nucleotidase